MGKYSKECPTCTRRYPTGCGTSTCLACKDALVSTQKAPTVDEDEWDRLSYIHGRVVPGPLSPENKAAWDADWELLEWRAEMASQWWGVADLLAAWPHSVRAA